MIERPLYVADASVVVRWYLLNPPFLTQALRVREDYQEQRISLIAPDNLLYELGGAIHQAVIRRFLSAEDGIQRYRSFDEQPIPLIGAGQLAVPAFELSLRFGCSFYDSIYLALAQTRNIPLIHADGNLRRALGGRFPFELWIEDYGLS